MKILLVEEETRRSVRCKFFGWLRKNKLGLKNENLGLKCLTINDFLFLRLKKYVKKRNLERAVGEMVCEGYEEFNDEGESIGFVLSI